MSTWEDRMAARAQAREWERERAERQHAAAVQAEYERRLAEEQRPEFEAGPPDGCCDCYVWAQDWFTPRHSWMHVTISEGDCTCYHSCHSKPVPCAPVVIG